MDNYLKRLNRWQRLKSSISANQLFLCGLEREAMRVQNDYWISNTSHPREIGSPLSHPFITTDFAESLLEFTTPPIADAEELMRFLDNTQKFVSDVLSTKDEYLWSLSMPPAIEDFKKVKIAQYGSSYAGRIRHIYRRGLALRYGKRMQTIAGIHFNLSFHKNFFQLRSELSDEVLLPNQLYFHLMRNYLRLSWLINYLFGASPALDRTFFEHKPVPHFLQPLGKRTFFHPTSTCLRMSPLGYVNQDTRLLRICFNDLEHYLNALDKMLSVEHPRYAEAGIKGEDQEYQQLNTNILQIENEYYASVRPKSTRTSEEKTIDMLRKNGVEYVEIRNLDIDPFSPCGINIHQIRFLQLLTTYCAIKDSPLIDDDECARISMVETDINMQNLDAKKKFMFASSDKPMTVKQATYEVLEELAPLAELLDQTDPKKESKVYAKSLAYVQAQVEDPMQHPTHRFIHLMRAEKLEYLEAGSLLKDQHRRYYASFSSEEMLQKKFLTESSRSWQKEQQLTAMHPTNDAQDFDKFLQDYFSPKTPADRKSGTS